MGKPKQEVCTIKIMFPVDSDEQAIDYKKKVSALVSEISDAHITFSLMTLPDRQPPQQ